MQLAFVVLSCALLFASLGSGPAHAQAPHEDPYDATLSAAISAHKQGHWEEARRRFAEAHALHPSARTLRGMGVSALEAGHFALAVRDLEAALVHPERPLDPTLAEGVRALVEEARAKIGCYRVTVDPEGASLLVDGVEPTRSASGELLLDPGEHTLAVSANGRVPYQVNVGVVGGERESMRVALSAIPIVPLAPAEVRVVSSEPGGPARAGHAPSFSPAIREPRRDGSSAASAPARVLPRVAWATTGVSALALASAGSVYLAGEKRVDSVARACAALPNGGCTPAQYEARIASEHITRMERTTSALLGVAVGSALVATVLWTRVLLRGKRASGHAHSSTALHF